MAMTTKKTKKEARAEARTGWRTIDDVLGRVVTLSIRRFGSPGALLALNEQQEILLLGTEIPEGAKAGDEVEVFVYLDSEARPIATTRAPKLEIGEVAFLEVTELTKFGAFVDWGMPKELLVPFAEQTTDLRVGHRYAIGIYLDESGRFAGTMKVSELLDRHQDVEWKEDEWVEGEAWRNEPEIGLFVIVGRWWFMLAGSAGRCCRPSGSCPDRNCGNAAASGGAVPMPARRRSMRDLPPKRASRARTTRSVPITRPTRR